MTSNLAGVTRMQITHVGSDWVKYSDGSIWHIGNGCAGSCGCGEVGPSISADSRRFGGRLPQHLLDALASS